MYVCSCICVRVSVYVYLYVCMCMHVIGSVSMYVCTLTYTYMPVCECTRVSRYTCGCCKQMQNGQNFCVKYRNLWMFSSGCMSVLVHG
jgi:hypothetical protein